MTPPPKVTVLMPVHNGEPYLAAAIDSILKQTFAEFELLIVDDGSNDRTSEIIRANSDPRVRLIHNPRNLGLIASLNLGLEQARGEYVARMDADDISLPARLEAQVAFLDRHPDVGVLGSAIQLIDAYGTPGSVVRFPGSHNLIRWALCFISPIAHPAATMRKAVVTGLGGYRPQALHCEDYDLWWRAGAVTRLANLDEVLLQLRKHDANITVRYAEIHGDTAVEVCRAALGDALQKDVPSEWVAALMGRAAITESQLAGAIELIFQYARICLSDLALEAEEEAALHEDLVEHILRWLDDPEAVVGSRARLKRLLRQVRIATSGPLTFSDKTMVCRLAAGRAADITASAARAAVRRRLTRLGEAMLSAYSTAVPRSARKYFTQIYEHNIFGSRESRSGVGSTLEQTATIRRELPALLRDLNAKSLLDAPCGDFNWLRGVDLGVERYIGVDIVRHLVEADERCFAGPGREFVCRDLIRDPLPPADVIFCRDCLVHLNFRDAQNILQNFKRSGSRYLLTTTFTGREANVDLTGTMVWRTLNLERAPFSLPPPLRVINENCTEADGAYADKSLALWRLEDLR